MAPINGSRRTTPTEGQGRWGLAVVATLGTLLALEIVLRVAAPQYANFVRPDDVVGFSYVPNAHYAYWPPEGCPGWGASGTINSHGLRDRDYDYAKRPGVYRILAVGDSFTEGLQFDLDQTWVKRLERALGARGDGVQYEVINAGRSGMGTGLEYLYFVEEGWKYHPDLVLLTFVPNDFADDSRVLDGTLQPYFTVSERGLRLDSSFSTTWSYRLRKVVNRLARASYLVELVRTTYAQRERRALHRPNRAADPDLASARAAAIEVTRELVRALADASRRHGARFAMAIASSEENTNWIDQVPGKEPENALEADAPSVMARFCRDEGIPFVDLSAVLQTYSAAHQAYVHGCAENGGRGHWSAVAHGVVADAIARFLAERSLLR